MEENNIYSELIAKSNEQVDPILAQINVTETVDPMTKNRTALIAAMGDEKSKRSPEGLPLQESIDRNRASIAMGEETVLRNQAAARQSLDAATAVRSMKEYLGVDFDKKQLAIVDQAYTNVLNWDLEQKAKAALEEEAINKIQEYASTNPYQAKILTDLFDPKRGNAEKILRDHNVVSMKLGQIAEEFGRDSQEEGWVPYLLKLPLNWFPTNANFQTSGALSGDGSMLDWLLPGNANQKEGDFLYNALNDMELEDRIKYLDGPFKDLVRAAASGAFGLVDDKQAAASMVSNFIHQTEQDRVVANLWGIGEVAGVIPMGKVIGITKNLRHAGSRAAETAVVREAADRILREGADAAQAATGLSAREVEDALSVSGITRTGSATDHSVPVAMDVANGEEAGRLAAEEMMQHANAPVDRLATNADEFQDAFKAAEGRFLSTMPNASVKDVKLGAPTILADGRQVHNIEFTLGRAKGGGFANEATAQKAAIKNGFEDAVVQVDDSGHWFYKVNRPISEEGFFVNEMTSPNQSWLSKLWGRWTRSAARITDEKMYGKGRQANDVIARLNSLFSSELRKTQAALSTEELRSVNAIGLVGTEKRRWWSREEYEVLSERLNGRPATDKEWKAYAQIRYYNDLDYALRKDQDYLTKAVRGEERLKFTNRNGNEYDVDGIVSAPDTLPSGRVYNLSDDVHYHAAQNARGRNNPLTSEKLKEYKDRGYIMLQLNESITMPGNVMVNNILIKKTDLKRAQVQSRLGYTEGGHNVYSDGVFIKQGRHFTQGDGSGKLLIGPKTFATSDNIANGRKWADTMNSARLAYKEGMRDATWFDEHVFQADPAYMDGEEFLDAVDKGHIQLDTEFEAVYDRELPSMYNKSGEDISRFLEAESGLNSYHQTVGRPYTGRKGEILRDTSGAISGILDPYDAISKSLAQVTRQNGLYNYKMESMERFINGFQDHLEFPKGANSNYEKFMDAKVRRGTPSDIENFIEAQRATIHNVLGFETPADKAAKQRWRTVSEWVLGEGEQGFRVKAHEAVNWWSQRNPVSFLRGLAFDMKLGLFNPAQLPLQAATIFSIAALRPSVMGKTGMAPMAAFLLRKGDETVLETLSKRGLAKDMGFATDEEFKFYARSMYKSGFLHMDGAHLMVGDRGPDVFGSSFVENNIRKPGRMFFYSAETMNRIVAFRAAWDEVLEKGSKPKDPGFLGEVAAAADDYSFNMTRESAAFWQKGLLSIPTQFWAYNARMMDAMLGKRFTPAQRIRLVLANMALYGTSGVPIVAGVHEFYKEKTGEEPPLGSVQSFFDRGALDNMLYHATGQNIRAGQKLGTGGWSTDVVREIFGFSEFDDKSLAEQLGGATYSITKSAAIPLADAFKYYVAESGAIPVEQSLTGDALLRFAMEISTVSNIMKWDMMRSYGIYKSQKGTIYADLPEESAMFLAFGFRPGELTTTAYKSASNKDRKDSIDEAVKRINNWRQEGNAAPDLMEDNLKKEDMLYKLLPEDIAYEVRRKVHRSRGNDDIIKSVAEKYEKNVNIENVFNEEGTEQ